MNDRFRIFAECVVFIAFQLFFRYVPVPDKRGVPKDEENHDDNDDPHTFTIA
jgi:hypothetical protein